MSFSRSAVLSSVAFVLIGTAGCEKGKQEPPQAPASVAVATTPVEPQPAEPKTDPECVAPLGTGTPESVTVGKTVWEINGSTMTQSSPAKGDTLVIGAITDIKEDSDDNKANLRHFAAWLTQNKADLILVAGDTGETAAQIEGALGVLAETKLPVFAISGNREGRKAFTAAMKSLRAKYGNVFSLNALRRVAMPQLEVISMPGYFNPHYIHAEDGCRYLPSDVGSVVDLAKLARAPTLLISHGGPKQEGPLAIDRTSEGDNVGDPELAKAIALAKIPFGVFGNIHEAGGHATDLSGKAVVKPGELVDSLYLHPGPADAVRWGMNDKSESVGMAALLTVKGGKAKYEVLRRADPEKKAAGAKRKKGRK